MWFTGDDGPTERASQQCDRAGGRVSGWVSPFVIWGGRLFITDGHGMVWGFDAGFEEPADGASLGRAGVDHDFGACFIECAGPLVEGLGIHESYSSGESWGRVGLDFGGQNVGGEHRAGWFHVVFSVRLSGGFGHGHRAASDPILFDVSRRAGRSTGAVARKPVGPRDGARWGGPVCVWASRRNEP